MSDFYGDKANYWFLYPTTHNIEKINSLLQNLSICNKIRRLISPSHDESQKQSYNEVQNTVKNWLWRSYADEVIDVEEGEHSFFAGYFVFNDKRVLSIQICYMDDFDAGSAFFGMDIIRLSENIYQVWKPDFDHNLERINMKIDLIQESIGNMTWKDVCCNESLLGQLQTRSSAKYIVLK